MVNVSKVKIDEQIYSKIYNQFISALTNLDKQKSVALIDDLLTEPEKIMLVKRLAIMVMLKEGLSNFTIRNSLKISPSTVTRISKLLSEKQSNFIESLFVDRGARRKFIKKILILRHELLPTRPSGASFRYLRDNKYKS
jgi:uncharacterized protein YerC